jgi:hypothetical protein
MKHVDIGNYFLTTCSFYAFCARINSRNFDFEYLRGSLGFNSLDIRAIYMLWNADQTMAHLGFKKCVCQF